MTEQPAAPTPSQLPADASPADAAIIPGEDAAPLHAPRQPGEPHPYMLQRNPPNLWILAAVTVFSLVLTVVVLVLTVLL